MSAIVWCVQPNIRQDATMQRQAQFIDQFAHKTIWDNVIIICEYNMWADSTNSLHNNVNFPLYWVYLCNQKDPCYFSLLVLKLPLFTYQPHWKQMAKPHKRLCCTMGADRHLGSLRAEGCSENDSYKIYFSVCFSYPLNQFKQQRLKYKKVRHYS